MDWMEPSPELDRLDAVLREEPEPPLNIMRVNQLDAGVLDKELHGLLKMQLGRTCSLLSPGFLERYKPEVDALFNFLLFRFTTWIHRPTPGMHLQGSIRWIAWGLMQRLDAAYRLAWLINLLLFLHFGKYASPVDRLLRMRMVYARMDSTPRPINYHFLNRKLLWDHWVKMTVAVAPMVDWAALGRAISARVGRLRRQGQAVGRGLGLGSGSGTELESGWGRGEEEGVRGRRLLACSDCGAFPPTMPYIASCGHMFCYHCARTACTRDRCYACPSCGETWTTSCRWSGPVPVPGRERT